MTRGPKGTDSFPVPPPEIHTGPDAGFFVTPDDAPEKSSMDKLIDINHYLMRRVEQLEELVEMHMQEQIREQVERMKEKGQ